MNEAEIRRMLEAEPRHWWYESLHRFLLGRLSRLELSGRTVLDLGSGSGTFLALLCARTGAKGIAVDHSPLAARSAAKKGLSSHCCDLQEGLSQAESPALVLLLDSLYFLEEGAQRQLLRSAFASLSQGGRIVLHLPHGPLFQREHDATVGIRRRYRKSEMLSLLPSLCPRAKIFARKRVAALAVGILARKAWQKAVPSEQPRSDLHPLPGWLHSLLLNWQCVEDRLPEAPWGSSLYVEVEKS